MRTLAEWYPGTDIVLAAVEILIIITCAIAIAWAAARIFASRRPALRSSLWHSALASVLLSPVLCLVGAHLPWHVGVLDPQLDSIQANRPIEPAELSSESKPSRTREEQLSLPEKPTPTQPVAISSLPSPERTAPSVPPMGVQLTAPAPSPTAVAPVNRLQAITSLIFLIWALGSVYLIARVLHGWRRVSRLWRGSLPIASENWTTELTSVARSLSLRRVPDVRTSSEVGSPLLIGLFRPRLLIPEPLIARSTTEQIREIFTHECAHILRRDTWTRLLQRFTVVLFWVHPLVHLLKRRLNQAREEVCDNFVLQHADAAEYAETLLTVALLSQPARSIPGYLTMLPHRQNLANRVAGLLDERRDTATRQSFRQQALVTAALLVTMLALSSFGLQSGARAQVAPSQRASETSAIQQKPVAPVKGKIAGKVVNAADDRPVSGAGVWMMPAEDRFPRDTPKRQTKTNAQGEFEFNTVSPGRYRVAATLKNLTSRSHRYGGDGAEVLANGSAKPLLLKMKPGISIRVKVLALADGKPIPRARLHLPFTDVGADQFANAQGELQLQALTPDRWTLEATADGFARESIDVDLAKEQPAVREFRLPLGGSIQGRIKDEQGRPLPNITLYVDRPERGPLPIFDIDGKTDSIGAFRFDNLPLSENLQLSAMVNVDYLGAHKQFLLEPKNDRISGFDLVLKKRPPGGSVEGVVNDRHGKPIAEAEVVNTGMPSGENRRTKTDQQGRFRLGYMFSSERRHFITVMAKGFAPKRVDFEPNSAIQPTKVAVKLEPGHHIHGRVVDEAGKPIAGIAGNFSTRTVGPAFAGLNNPVRTNADGRFQFDSLPMDALFAFGGPGYSTVRNVSLPLDGDKEVIVTLKSKAFIKGKVLDVATHKPVPSFTVRISNGPGTQPALGRRSNLGEEFISATGEFQLNDLNQDANFQLTVLAEGYERLVIRGVDAKSAAKVQPVEFRLTRIDASKLFTLSGKLVNHRGEPIHAANLILIVAKNRPLRLDAPAYDWQAIETGRIEQAPAVLQVLRKITAADGTFTFPGLPADAELELAYWGKGFPRSRRANLEKLSEPERGNLIVKALASARIVGTIDRQVFPAVQALSLRSMMNFTRVALADDAKNFAIEDLPPGSFEIQLMGPSSSIPGGPPGMRRANLIGRKSVTLKEGEEAKVTLGEADKFTPLRP